MTFTNSTLLCHVSLSDTSAHLYISAAVTSLNLSLLLFTAIFTLIFILLLLCHLNLVFSSYLCLLLFLSDAISYLYPIFTLLPTFTPSVPSLLLSSDHSLICSQVQTTLLVSYLVIINLTRYFYPEAYITIPVPLSSNHIPYFYSKVYITLPVSLSLVSDPNLYPSNPIPLPRTQHREPYILYLLVLKS